MMEKNLFSGNRENQHRIFKNIRFLGDSSTLVDPSSSVLNSFEDLAAPSPHFIDVNLAPKDLQDFKSEKTISSIKMTGYSKIQELKLVKVGMASAEKILEWSEKILPNGKIFGEVLNANTLHYKTFKPHKGGLFCERIFGPLKDFECACGLKQKSFDEQSLIKGFLHNTYSMKSFCPVCDVEYTWSVIRRYQLGYIKLASPVTHLWYLRTNPSYLSLLLSIKKRDLEAMVYCTQITTLEYYWKPMNSLQFNLTAENLIESYKSYKKYKFENRVLRTRFNLLKAQIEKKQRFELHKRKNQKVERQGYYFFSTETKTSRQLRALQNESLETKKEYLEKSFRLSSDNVYDRVLNRPSRVQNFLRGKQLKNVKKRDFLMISRQWNQRFYKQVFFFISQKSLFTFSKMDPQQDFKNNRALHSILQEGLKGKFKELLGKPKHDSQVSICQLAWVTKNCYVIDQHSNNPKKGINMDSDELFDSQRKNAGLRPIRPFGSVRSDGPDGSTRSNGTEVKDKHALIVLNKLLVLNKKPEFKQSWDSVYKNIPSSIDLVLSNHRNSPRRFTDRKISNFKSTALKKGIQKIFCFYLLSGIQESANVFSRNPETLVFKERLTKKTLAKNDFLFKSFKTNHVLPGIQKDRLSIQMDQKRPIPIYVHFLLKFIDRALLKFLDFPMFRKRFQKSRKDFLVFFQTQNEKNWSSKMEDQNIIFSKVLNLKKRRSIENEVLFRRLMEQKKFFPCLKYGYTNVFDSSFYIKTLQYFIQKLVSFKHRIANNDFYIRNNIYTVAYSTGWSTEKEWRYFLYYNTAPIEFVDQTLLFYKNRLNPELFLNNNSSIAVPIIGANLVRKILFQYEGNEIRKMAKQSQNILPKLNRFIRFSKEEAKKRSDFLRLNRLLQKRDQTIRRLKLLRKFVKRNVIPSSTILTVLPVLPPDLRPILKMQNQIAASDLNRFYQRILYRNERLKKFLKSNVSALNIEPGFEIKYAQRLLQEAVDNLIQNGKGQVKPETNSRGQPLKSLSEILKGKQGRFRQYLLGKRVDYSGRSVIVVGPKLKIYQCGLPFEMALELFLPFLIQRIFHYRYARTIVGAKALLKTQKSITWSLLEEIMEDCPILLNRAPTLHRLGIQAFQPKLIEGRAILLHPLVCPAFNADFDGDQMAVHLPITVEARAESWKLMLSRNHLLSPATGDPMLLPSQDMVLGCYYLTNEALQIHRFNTHRPFFFGTRFYFSNCEQVLAAYQQQRIHLQTPIWLKWNGRVEMDSDLSLPFEIRLDSKGSWTELRTKRQRTFTNKGVCPTVFLRTTAGRVFVNNIVENCIQSSFPPKARPNSSLNF